MDKGIVLPFVHFGPDVVVQTSEIFSFIKNRIRRMVYRKKIKMPWRRRKVVSRKRKGSAAVYLSRATKRRKYGFTRVKRSRAIATVANILPTKRLVKHEYVANLGITHATALPQALQKLFAMRVNSLYDPSVGIFTSADKNPNLYSYMYRFYGRYRVLWCSATFTLKQRDFAAATPSGYRLFFGVKKDNDNAIATTTGHMAIGDRTSWKIKRFRVEGSNAGKMNQCSVHQFWSEKEMDKADLSDNVCVANTNPAASYYMLPCWSYDTASSFGTVATDNFDLDIKVTFLAEWSDRRDIDTDSLIIDDT